MTFAIPFDGSDLAEAALLRAAEFGRVLDEDLVVVCVVPERKRYAREKGWIGDDEQYDVDEVVSALRHRIHECAPGADVRCERIREFPPGETIADHIERLLEEYDPTVVFLGSENVGRVVTPLASVGVGVTATGRYDVYLVRSTSPPIIGGLEDDSEGTGKGP